MAHLHIDGEKSGLLSSLSEIGISYDSGTWALKSKSNSVADKIVVIDWKGLLGANGDQKAINNNYSELLKLLAAGLILGLDGSYASSTIKQRIIWLRGFFWHLQTDGYEILSIVDAFTVSKILSKCTAVNSVISKATLDQRINILNQAHRLRFFTGIGFAGDPITKRSLAKINLKLRESIYWEAPPEPVCIYLLREAIRFIDQYAERIIELFTIYTVTVDKALANGCGTKKQISNYVNSIATDDIYRSLLNTIEEARNWSPSSASLAKLLKLTFTACFIVITFTSGPRVSELRRASSKSLRSRKHDNGMVYFYYHAVRSKLRFSSHTNVSSNDELDHDPWILAPAAVNAFQTLIKLSEPFREKSGIDNLWLTTRGNALWPFNPKKGFTVMSSSRVNAKMNQFADFIDLSKETKWTGKLHSHMGRKHLARFVAKRDRAMLGELALQYSHLSPQSVDISYARPDSEFRRMVQEELVKEMDFIGRELLLSDPDRLYQSDSNNAGNRVSKFLGELRLSKDVKLLVSSGTILFPCQWGVCLYREETSACRGSKSAPNVITRTPKVCADCSNFFATSRHRLWWEEYRQDSFRILKQNNIPLQTKLLLRERVEKAEQVLTALEEGTI